MRRHRRGIVGTIILAALAIAAGGEGSVPWPHGAPPTSTELDSLVVDALDLFALERFDEFFEAFEKGEDSEHIHLRQERIDEGVWDKDALFNFGDSLFDHEFRGSDGYGAQPNAKLQRVHDGTRGGLDTFSCVGCHSLGGPDGAGAATQNTFFFGDGDAAASAQVRNPPHVLGLGFIQAVAAEMSAELQGLRDDAIKQATESGEPVTVALVTRGVDYGALTAHQDGGVDSSGIDGIDDDLVVKPFGWKGRFATLRRTIEDAARVHFGIQSHVLALQWMEEQDPALGNGPDWWDPDGDGHQRELEEGILTAGATYLAMLEGPVVIPPHDPQLRDRWAHGSALMDEVGCTDCHRRELLLTSPFWDETPDTTDGPPIRISLLIDGEGPKPSPLVQLYSDLKRHDMGPSLADPHADDGTGVAASVFLTRPLWGLAETPPYLHDGRALTIPEAITMHDGQGADSRDAFLALPESSQADLHIFLLSLTREPKVRVPR
ncbi:MAG: hypothetical protein JKY37_02810 [Nannocystaceae bacterium]|nr:hypothetical protein [Nannocystaceae bacterium]